MSGALFALLLLLCACAGAQEPTESIKSPHREVIQRWLAAHPGYRLATSADCQCDEDIEFLRKGDGAAWEPQPGFQPYLAAGDFNGDGLQDIAVVAIAPSKHAGIFVLVSLDGRNGNKRDIIQIPRDGTSVSNRGLFVRTSDIESKNQRSLLLFGAFSSEAEELPIERAKGVR